MEDFRDELRLEKAPQPFQRNLDEDVAREHGPQDLLRVAVRLALGGGLVAHPPHPAQRQVADETVLLAVVAELEFVQRRGLDGADDLRSGDRQNRLVEFWIFTIHNCELKAES